MLPGGIYSLNQREKNYVEKEFFLDLKKSTSIHTHTYMHTHMYVCIHAREYRCLWRSED